MVTQIIYRILVQFIHETQIRYKDTNSKINKMAIIRKEKKVRNYGGIFGHELTKNFGVANMVLGFTLSDVQQLGRMSLKGCFSKLRS